jgi:hypothetical protein
MPTAEVPTRSSRPTQLRSLLLTSGVGGILVGLTPKARSTTKSLRGAMPMARSISSCSLRTLAMAHAVIVYPAPGGASIRRWRSAQFAIGQHRALCRAGAYSVARAELFRRIR